MTFDRMRLRSQLSVLYPPTCRVPENLLYIYMVKSNSLSVPIRVGIVGGGYTARTRAQVLQEDERSQLMTIAGHTPENTESLAQKLGLEASVSWRKLVEREDLDLVVICTINRDHGTIARAALEQGKHVIVEYPLSLDPAEAQELITLAQRQNKLLHVEHIELLGGLHQAIKQSLPAIGQVFYARYITINPKHPAPQKWTYQPSLFGFPFSGALSRLHRLIDLFGSVASVNCHSQFWNQQADIYRACLCHAQLKFSNGVLAESVYGKGDVFWQPENLFTLYGETGTLIFTPKQGQLFKGNDTPEMIEVGTRQGSFAKDTHMVLEHLLQGTPLYIQPSESAYTLKVADAARRSAEIGQTVVLNNEL